MKNNGPDKSHGIEYEEIGRKLKVFRESKGYNQVQFSKLLNMAQSTYAGYESGNRKIPLSLLKRIINHYKMDANYFFYDD